LEKDNIKELRDLSAALLNDLDQNVGVASMLLNCSAAPLRFVSPMGSIEKFQR
jgi:hypothetical protein